MKQIRAITFDVFGTLLSFPETNHWMGAYSRAVHAVQIGLTPYRPLSVIFKEINADWKELTPRSGVLWGLKQLKDTYFTAMMSNADYALAIQISDYFGLDWNYILGTESAKSFKPDPRVYCLGLRRLSFDAHQMMHVASHPFDLKGAKAMGYNTGYLAWPGYAEPIPEGTFDLQVQNFSELVVALESKDK